MMRNRPIFLWILAVLAVLAVSCGASDGGGPVGGDADGAVEDDADGPDQVDNAVGESTLDEYADESQEGTTGVLTDGEWVLQVDRKWNGDSGSVQFPSDPLPEEAYEPVNDGDGYLVVFSNGQESVAVGDTPLLGEQASYADGRREYDLTTGTFAGGRFIVWPGAAGLQAELTIYGSGVPIISSERGALTPKP